MIRRRGRRWWTSSKEGKFELLALTEAKLKGNGEVPSCGVNGISAGVQEMGRYGHSVE